MSTNKAFYSNNNFNNNNNKKNIISISIKEYRCQTIYKNINDYGYDFLKN